MYTYVFVYSPSKFRVDGERQQLKQFQPNQMYTTVGPVISEGEEKVIDPGIYVIPSEEDDVTPGLHAVESRITVDYDRIDIAEKDPWPTIVGEESRLDPAMSERVRGAFPTVRDEDLKGFYIAQKIRAG